MYNLESELKLLEHDFWVWKTFFSSFIGDALNSYGPMTILSSYHGLHENHCIALKEMKTSWHRLTSTRRSYNMCVQFSFVHIFKTNTLLFFIRIFLLLFEKKKKKICLLWSMTTKYMKCRSYILPFCWWLICQYYSVQKKKKKKKSVSFNITQPQSTHVEASLSLDKFNQLLSQKRV